MPQSYPPRCGRGPLGLRDSVSTPQAAQPHARLGAWFCVEEPHAPRHRHGLTYSGRRRHHHDRRRRRRSRGIPASAAVAAVLSLRARPQAEIAERTRVGRAVLSPHTRRSPKTEARGYASGNCRTFSRGNGLPRDSRGWPETAEHNRFERALTGPSARPGGGLGLTKTLKVRVGNAFGPKLDSVGLGTLRYLNHSGNS